MKRLVGMGACRLSFYLKKHDGDSFLEKYKGLLDPAIDEAEILQLEENYLDSLLFEQGAINRAVRLLLQQPGIPAAGAGPVEAARLPENRIAIATLELCLLLHMSEELGELFRVLYPKGKGSVTVGLTSKLLYGEDFCIDNPGCIGRAYNALSFIFNLKNSASDILSEAVAVDNRLVDYLGGGDDLSLLGNPFIETYGIGQSDITETVFRTADIHRVSCQLQAYESIGVPDNVPVVSAIGEAKSGRKYLLKKVAEENGHELLLVPFFELRDMINSVNGCRRILRESILTERALCVTDIETDEHTGMLINILVREYERVLKQAYVCGVSGPARLRPLYLTGDGRMKPAPFIDRLVCQVECKTPNMTEAAMAWDCFAEKYLEGKRLNSRELAVKMKLPYGKIEQIVKKLRYSPVQDFEDSRYIFKCCYELLDDGRYDNIKRVETTYTIDDLKLDEIQKSVIMDICNQVEYRRRVMDDWRLRSRYSYGTCVSALFSGPPGTGKTMAVHVMAGILGLELYKVDVSQLVDKYIGETEKRLEEVFRRAEKSNMILFFDEADSIIGKRSEVKDSNDKYANTEVSYLLQRMEEYDGIVILASNYSQNIDSAIMRRIRYTVHFPLPSEETRRGIWESAFSSSVPLDRIDFDYLAKQFEFSGGQIKNIVLNTVFMAAAEDKPVSMRHIIRAISLDLTKDKKVAFHAEDLGKYSYLLEYDVEG